MAFYTTDECIDYICDSILTPNLGSLTPTVNAIYRLEYEQLPDLPAIAVLDNRLRRTYSGSHMFTLVIGVQLVVMHGFLGSTPAQRSKEDIQLARQVVLLLHADRTLGGNIAQGWVTEETAGGVPLPSKESTVKCSFLNWIGEQREIDVT